MICILFENRDFEHDIYELIRAFYPAWELTCIYSDGDDPSETADPAALFFHVRYDEGSFRILCRLQDSSTREIQIQDAGQTGDEAGDALICCQETEDRETRLALRRDNKDRIKHALYRLLCSITGRTLPWGSLTGIRPVKLAMAMLEEGADREAAETSFQTHYQTRPEKAALAVSIAQTERRLLRDVDMEGGWSLYAGIPFCPSICLYCSFSSYPLGIWKKSVNDYVDTLIYEIGQTARMMSATGRRLQTIYIGGGTPTTLEPEQLDRLLSALDKAFGFEDLLEFTVEAGRPDSINAEKLDVLRHWPITRISVNPQTMNQETLDLIGRRHTVDQTKEAFYMARDRGFDNINMDLIIGLPGENADMVRHTLDEIFTLSPDSLTVHTLALKRAARLNLFKDQYREISFENSQQIMDMTMETAVKMQMKPYYLYRQKNMNGNFENVGYAKVDKAGIYNILIMEEKQPVIAVGAGGASKLVYDSGRRLERVENVKDVSGYINRIDEMIARKEPYIAALGLSKGD
ncbi:MAG: coproporphyrinogen dehydrogenase HemZ [Blautia sp.]|nr:coproporphyrinogen dehydrogenase HemZ [Blautia sp.]